MKARWAWKLAILAIVVLGLLAGCSLFQSSATITFDSYDDIGYTCAVDGDTLWIDAWGVEPYTATWSGKVSKTFFVEVYNTSYAYYDSLYVTLSDGGSTTITIDFY